MSFEMRENKFRNAQGRKYVWNYEEFVKVDKLYFNFLK
jgi:hypothetical protein